MTEPTPVVRAVTYERDEHRCVSCGALSPLQYQHRAAEGMGGRKRRPRLEEGVASCASCNPRYESDLQARALACGWKVRRWVAEQGLTALVPVFYAWAHRWAVLGTDGGRTWISDREALGMLREVYGEEFAPLVSDQGQPGHLSADVRDEVPAIWRGVA